MPAPERNSKIGGFAIDDSGVVSADSESRVEERAADDATHSMSGSLPAGAAPALRSSDANELAPGTVLEPYVIRSTIASGGGGSVYLADDLSTGQACAIKVLHAELARSQVGVARFAREMAVLNKIRHPAIVEIYKSGKLADGRPYFAMEWLDGSNLKQLIKERGRFSIEQVLEILTPICSALGAAHAAGIVHRDVKASNVHVSFRDGHCVLKLLDFGVAKLLAPEDSKEGLSRAGSSIGTPATMAPEQLRGEAIDERTDVYAVGVLVYQMLTGRLPFHGASRQETEVKILEGSLHPPSQLAPLPVAIDAVVLRCLERVPARRYPSIAAVEEAFRLAAASTFHSPHLPTTKRAVAISIAVVSQGPDPTDDHLVDDLANVLDSAELALREAGFENLFQMATSVVGARALSPDETIEHEQLAAARAEALALLHRIASREGARAALRVEIRVHAAEAFVCEDGFTQEIRGPIIDVASWPAETLVRG